MQTSSALLMLSAQTFIHAGSDQAVAGIDLPIQREVHTTWPCVYGSAVKGALRARAFHHQRTEEGRAFDVVDIFGPEHAAAAGERDSAHAGALMVGDARLLLLPVRSLHGYFKWVTCPAILRRLHSDARRMGLTLDMLPALTPKLEEAWAAVADEGDKVFLEELRLTVPASECDAMTTVVTMLENLLGEQVTGLKERLLVLHDDMFSYLARHATSVQAHIALDAATKTVKSSALWYEESLPPETVMYVPVSATASRSKSGSRQAHEVMDAFLGLFGSEAGRQWLQLGGNETTGMGWFEVGVQRAPGQAAA